MRFILVTGLLLSMVAGVSAQDGTSRAKAAYARAVELESQGNHAAALSLLWEAAGLTPRDPVVLSKAGRGAEAVTRARAMVSAAPSDPDAHFVLGLAQSEVDVNDAIASFQRALSLAPRHALAGYNLALVLRRLDRLPEALQELERTIAIEPRAQPYYLRGVIYWHQGDATRAAQSLRAAIDREPGYAEAHYTLGSVLKSQRNWKGAAAALRRAIALRPDSASHYTLAQVLASEGDQAGSRQHFEEAERLRRETELEREALTWTSVGIQKMQAGDPASAVDDFRRATTTFERTEEARVAFSRARELNPSLVSPRDTRGPPK
jgi:tetratricopeptide (TPR) repeat protein